MASCRTTAPPEQQKAVEQLVDRILAANRRIGVEISARTVKRALDVLVAEQVVRFEGERRWRKYWLADSSYSYKGQGGE